MGYFGYFANMIILKDYLEFFFMRLFWYLEGLGCESSKDREATPPEQHV